MTNGGHRVGPAPRCPASARKRPGEALWPAPPPLTTGRSLARRPHRGRVGRALHPHVGRHGCGRVVHDGHARGRTADFWAPVGRARIAVEPVQSPPRLSLVSRRAGSWGQAGAGAGAEAEAPRPRGRVSDTEQSDEDGGPVSWRSGHRSAVRAREDQSAQRLGPEPEPPARILAYVIVGEMASARPWPLTQGGQ